MSEAFSQLSETDQEILRLIAWDDLRPAEAAHVLGCSENTFNVRLHRVRQRFRTQLTALEGTQTAHLIEEDTNVRSDAAM